MNAALRLGTALRIGCLSLLTSLFLAASEGDRSRPADTVSLAGPWRFQLDRADAGIPDRWFTRTLPDKITLPGTLPLQGIGDPVTVATQWIGGIFDRSWFDSPDYAPYRQPGNVKVPFWLQPEKYYAGAAWYQRDVTIPANWAARHLVLTLERPHWETRVWIDDRLIGTADALGTAHVHDLGVLTPGTHRLTVRVDNRMIVDVGENSHSISDHTQGNWNGIVGRIELSAHAPFGLAHQRIIPRNDGTVRVALTFRGTPPPASSPAHVVVAIRDRQARMIVARTSAPLASLPATPAQPFTTEVTVKLTAPPQLWNEFSPHLYTVESHLSSDPADVLATSFGFRELTTQGTQFVLNGQKTFFRGTLDCANYPRTGHPPTDVAEWKRILGIIKSHGLNLVRFHSWCPPEAAFVAADELGFYFHVEASSWPNHSTKLGSGQPVDAWLYAETDRILRAYGHHPSFVLMACGNEPGGPQHRTWLAKWVNHYKTTEPRILFTSAAGWPELAENQWHSSPKPRIHAWGDGLKSRINARAPETLTDYRDFISKRTVPVISHEIGQWCVYPNFAEIEKYTGYLKARNFEIFRDTLRARGLADQAKAFLLASGKLQTLCYKEDIESALRTPGMGGFELLDLHDFPGQGTALVGVLDAFWEEKGYVTPAEYRRFCDTTVPLARLARRVFTADETFSADVEVAHFGPAPLPAAVATWQLVDDSQRVVAHGQLPAQTIPVDNAVALGHVSASLRQLPAPARYRFVVALQNTPFENDWHIWVYPPKPATPPPAPSSVLVTSALDAAALSALEAGGRVFLTIPPARVRNDVGAKVALGFSSIFWNTAWTRGQAPTTLGILCDPAHPALSAFPTDFHSNWQWWYLVSRAAPLRLDALPAATQPIVQVIDDWFTARKLGLVFEAQVRRGRLLVCSIDLSDAAGDNPVARQLRASLLAYAASDRFAPTVAVDDAALAGLFTEK